MKTRRVKKFPHLSRESLSESHFRVRVDTSEGVRDYSVVQARLIGLKQ